MLEVAKSACESFLPISSGDVRRHVQLIVLIFAKSCSYVLSSRSTSIILLSWRVMIALLFLCICMYTWSKIGR